MFPYIQYPLGKGNGITRAFFNNSDIPFTFRDRFFRADQNTSTASMAECREEEDIFLERCNRMINTDGGTLSAVRAF